jgi:DNA-binding transcriptional LysR family regulator
MNNKLFDLKALEAFQAAMASGSMTEAARQLGIGQPAVTRLVKDLEAAAGFQLFHRNGPRISPTDRGLRFYEEVQRLMSGMRQIRERADAIREAREPSLDIAATPTMAGGLLGPALALMGDVLPGIVNAQTMDAEHVVRSLRARTADFGISAFPLEHAGLTGHVICQSRVIAVVAENDPLAAGETVSLEALATRRLVTVGNVHRLRRAIEVELIRSDVRPRGEFATNSSLNAVMAARAGLGLALVDPVTAFGIPIEGVVARPLDVEIPYLWGLFSASDRVLNRPMTYFVEGFRQACADIIPGCVFHDAADSGTIRRIAARGPERIR